MKAKRLIPRPDTIEDFMLLMQMAFRPELAGDIKAVLQFTFSGVQDGSCFFIFKNGIIEVSEGTSTQPALLIETPFDLWMDILTGKADGQKMFMEGKYSAKGDLKLLMRMNEIFGG
jgi:putative sterol carrier protein